MKCLADAEVPGIHPGTGRADHAGLGIVLLHYGIGGEGGGEDNLLMSSCPTASPRTASRMDSTKSSPVMVFAVEMISLP
ncbi:MAG: hypothetical protein MZV63_57785 [Marinilabiliales bacterium]|nr:hypothetical protein [Marinilabiliales bacterium]